MQKKPILTALLWVSLIFLPVLTFEFVAFDDGRHIWSNPFVRNFSLENWHYIWTSPYFGLYIPLTYTTWSLASWASSLFGLTHPATEVSPIMFHLLNLLLHLTNTFLIFRLSKKVLSSGSESISIWIALLWALHPVQVEAVAWTSELKGVLAASLALFSMILFMSGQGRRNLIAATLVFVLSLLAKPAVVILPLILAAYIFLHKPQNWRRHAQVLLVWIALAIPLIFYTQSLQPNVATLVEAPFWQRIPVALFSLGFALRQLFFPAQLAPDYGWTLQEIMKLTPFPLTLMALGLLTVLSLAVLLSKRKPLAWPLSLFVIGLLPVLGFVPFEFQKISTVADRYLYLFPTWGFALFVQSLLKNQHRAVLLSFLVVLSVLTHLQLKNWKENSSLFSSTLLANPKSYLSHNNIGLDLLRKGQLQEAEVHFRKALEHNPDYLTAQSNLGAALFKQKKFSEVIRYYEHILEQWPEAGPGADATFADIHFNLGASYLNTGHIENCLQNLHKAVKVNPLHFSSYFQLGRVYLHLGIKDKARFNLEKAYQLKPTDPGLQAELKRLREEP